MRDRSQISRIVVCAAQLIATGVAAASAITSTWLGGTGNWNDATRWTAGIPDAGYQVLVDGGNPFSSVVTVDASTPLLNNVAVDAYDTLVLQQTLSSGEVTSFGGITVHDGATLNVGATGLVQDRGTAALTIQAGGNLLDAGSYSQGNGSTQVNGNLSTSLFHVTGGSVRTGSGGVLDIGTGGFTQAGSTVNIIDAGGKMTSAGFVAQGGGTTIVNGVLSAVLFHFTGDSVLVGSGGTLTSGSGGYTQGKAGTTTTIMGGGQLVVSGGDYSQEIGTSTIVNGVLTADTINNSGDFSGVGTISGLLRNLGSVSPGNDGIGELTDIGQYDQSGFLYIDIGGPSQADLLSISGAATLSGTLAVDLLGGFTPDLGDTFRVLSFGSRTGDFTDFSTPSLPPGLSWQETYDDHDLYVSVVPTVPEPVSVLLLLTGLGVFALRKTLF